MLSKTSVPVRPATVQVQAAFPLTFWEPSAWVTMWSCSVKVPLISPVSTPAGNERVTNVFPSAVRKSDGTGAATKKKVPLAETGVDAATGWMATRARDAASGRGSIRIAKRVMDDLLLNLLRRPSTPPAL